MTATARVATLADVPTLVAIINKIIALGGTTAHETPFTEDQFAAHYLTNPRGICCHAAEDATGRLSGFQVLSRSPAFPEGWAEIGSFVDPNVQRSGAGAALFAATLAVAKAKGIATLDATIRADNLPGLGYYSRIGFRDYKIDSDYTLKDGTRVGRISKRFDVIA